MKKLFFLLALLISQVAFADTFDFTWTAPPSDATNAPAGYRLYVSTTSGTYSTTPRLTSTSTNATLTDTTIGKYFAVVTAYNVHGESGRSNEVTFEIKGKPPGTPGSLTILQRVTALIKKAFNIG